MMEYDYCEFCNHVIKEHELKEGDKRWIIKCLVCPCINFYSYSLIPRSYKK